MRPTASCWQRPSGCGAEDTGRGDARTEEYKRAVGPHRDGLDDALPVIVCSSSHLLGSARVEAADRGARTAARGPRSAIVSRAGDDWRFDESSFEICRDFLRCLLAQHRRGRPRSVRAHVRAGFDSRHRMGIGLICSHCDVPAERRRGGGRGRYGRRRRHPDRCRGLLRLRGRLGRYTGYNVYPVTGGVVADELVAAIGLEHQFGGPDADARRALLDRVA